MSKNKLMISPSIIASDLSRIGQDVKKFDSSVIDLLHMDVMDGHFVPNLTFGPGFIKNLKGNTDIPLDVHLMIEKPENTIDEYIALKPWCITFHYESTNFPIRIMNVIREAGIVAGITINPATSVESVYDLLPYSDMILLMSVDPGFAGQSFMDFSVGRIEKLAEFLVKHDLDKTLIQVDGGINTDNISTVVDAGASVVVAGSSAFRGGDVNQRVAELKKSAGF